MAPKSHLLDHGELVVVLEEEGQVLERDVDVGVPALLAMLLKRRSSTRERVLVDLVLDLLLRVRHEDARRVDTGRHLALRAEQRRDELGVDKRRLLVLEPRGRFACQAEVGVLVDRARDQARDVRLGAEDLGERVGEGRRGLNRDKVPLADVVAKG